MSKKEHSFGIIPLQLRQGEWFVFIVKHQAGHWGFPKGHAISNEIPFAAAKRELFEETGLEIVKRLVEEPLTEYYTCIKEEGEIDKCVTYFLAEVKGEEALQQMEIAEGKWLPLDEVVEHLTFKQMKKIAKEVKDWIKRL